MYGSLAVIFSLPPFRSKWFWWYRRLHTCLHVLDYLGIFCFSIKQLSWLAENVYCILRCVLQYIMFVILNYIKEYVCTLHLLGFMIWVLVCRELQHIEKFCLCMFTKMNAFVAYVQDVGIYSWALKFQWRFLILTIRHKGFWIWIILLLLLLMLVVYYFQAILHAFCK